MKTVVGATFALLFLYNISMPTYYYLQRCLKTMGFFDKRFENKQRCACFLDYTSNDISSDAVYQKIRNVDVSLTCESAAIDYFKIIAPICMAREDVAHSLLRLAIRPIFYLGLCTADDILSNISIFISDSYFCEWLYKNKQMVQMIVIELCVCCLFYDGFTFNEKRGVVVFSHSIDSTMNDIFVAVPDRNIYKEFVSFNEFCIYFRSLFAEYGVPQIELDRLILEEEYEKQYLACQVS